MATARRTPVASPSSPRESDQGFETRQPRSPRKSSRKSSAAAVVRSQRTVIETLKEEGGEESEYNPRAFPNHVKRACWEKADKVKGRDPNRWRRDPLGNIVFRKLVGCSGCLCHDYDHIVPYSKECISFRFPHLLLCRILSFSFGGKSTVENCQVLQATANRVKSNRTDMSTTELIQKSAYCRIAGRDMDFVELSAYGNVQHGQETGGCRIQ